MYGATAACDARVILGDADVQQSPVGIDNRDAGLVFLAPSKIEANEVHRPMPAGAYPRRKLCVCDDP